MRHDLLSDALSLINNAERVGKTTCVVPTSSFVKSVLGVVKAAGYMGDIHEEKGIVTVTLLGKLNKIRVVRPRFSVKKGDFDEWERRYLPSKDTGILIVSTSQGMMTQKDAVSRGLGGKIVAFAY